MPVNVKGNTDEYDLKMAERKGYHSFYDGIAFTRNPFYDWSTAHLHWRNGWVRAYREFFHLENLP